MSYQLIRAALESKLNAISPAVSTAWENVPFEPAIGQMYQRAFMLPAGADNTTFGNTLRRESGIFQVSVCAPLGNGSYDAITRAEVIRNWFYRGLTLTQSGVLVRILRTASIAPAITEEANYVVPVSIPYFSDIT